MASNFSIESQRLDGSNRTVLFQGSGDFHGLAYDWIGKNIYWASATKLHIFNTNNATLQKTLIQVYYPEYIHTYITHIILFHCSHNSSNCTNCKNVFQFFGKKSTQQRLATWSHTHTHRSLVVDPRKGVLYWSTWVHNDGNPRILCAWMDGTHETVFVEAGNSSKSRSMAWPSSLALDYVGRKLYWSDPLLKTIERIGLDGQNREVVLLTSSVSMESTPYAMAYHMGYLYFTEFFPKDGIKKLPINDTKSETLQLTR